MRMQLAVSGRWRPRIFDRSEDVYLVADGDLPKQTMPCLVWFRLYTAKLCC